MSEDQWQAWENLPKVKGQGSETVPSVQMSAVCSVARQEQNVSRFD